MDFYPYSIYNIVTTKEKKKLTRIIFLLCQDQHITLFYLNALVLKEGRIQ